MVGGTFFEQPLSRRRLASIEQSYCRGYSRGGSGGLLASFSWGPDLNALPLPAQPSAEQRDVCVSYQLGILSDEAQREQSSATAWGKWCPGAVWKLSDSPVGLCWYLSWHSVSWWIWQGCRSGSVHAELLDNTPWSGADSCWALAGTVKEQTQF